MVLVRLGWWLNESLYNVNAMLATSAVAGDTVGMVTSSPIWTVFFSSLSLPLSLGRFPEWYWFSWTDSTCSFQMFTVKATKQNNRWGTEPRPDHQVVMIPQGTLSGTLTWRWKSVWAEHKASKLPNLYKRIRWVIHKQTSVKNLGLDSEHLIA